MMRARVVGVAVAIAGVVVALVAPSSAHAALTCGSQITKDRKLHADLDCSGYNDPALTIDADGVKLDLNGHTITGPETTNGIFADQKRRGVTIKNGEISGYNHAIVMLSGGRDLTVSNLELEVEESNSMGVEIGNFKHVRMDRLEIRDANYGIFAFDNEDVVVRDSRIRAGAATGQTIGINIGSNVADHSGAIDDVKVSKATYGFFLFGTTTGFVVTDSAANDGGTAGFNIGNGDAPRKYTIKRNTANDNDQYGFFAAERVTDSAGNKASGNGTKDCVKVRCL